MDFFNRRFYRLLPALMFTVAMTGCVNNAVRDEAAALPAELNTSPAKGYLQPSALPNSVALLPPPPIAGSTGFALDEEYSKKSFTLRDTPAWTLAILDADLTFPNAAGTYSCALNAPINEQDTPHIYTLLRRTLKDAGSSTGDAKKYYLRPRPFLVNNKAICTPGERSGWRKAVLILLGIMQLVWHGRLSSPRFHRHKPMRFWRADKLLG